LPQCIYDGEDNNNYNSTNKNISKWKLRFSNNQIINCVWGVVTLVFSTQLLGNFEMLKIEAWRATAVLYEDQCSVLPE